MNENAKNSQALMDFFKENTTVESWKDFKMPWGNHTDWSMWQIYHCDYSYISEFLISKCNDSEVLAAAQAAVAHKERVDPWSR